MVLSRLTMAAVLLPAAALCQEDAAPRVVTPGQGDAPPSDAVVLFNGKDMSGWLSTAGGPSRWKVENGEMLCVTYTGSAYTERKFGSAQIHLEFKVPDMPQHKGQLKGNSGVYLGGATEIQILDGYNNPTYALGVVGAIYNQHPPLVNASRKPGEWQTCDIVYHAPVCDSQGAVREEGTVTLFLNGVLVQDHAGLKTRKEMCQPGPLLLQDHSGFKGAPVTEIRFRNLWSRPL